MSLIGEALRKTRREAAEREVERRGVLYSSRIADAPARSNLGLGLLLGALIAVVATVVGGVAVWWLFIGNEPDRQAETSAVQIAPDAVAAPATDSGDSQPEPQGAGTGTAAGTGAEAVARAGAGTGVTTGTRTGAGPAAATESESGSASDSGSESESGPAPATVPVGGDDRRPRSAAPPDTGLATGYAGTEDGDEVYILEADVGGAHLELDYIVYRSVDPFAEINGIEVHQGSTVAGFRVKAIEKDRVRLSDGRRTIVLRAP